MPCSDFIFGCSLIHVDHYSMKGSQKGKLTAKRCCSCYSQSFILSCINKIRYVFTNKIKPMSNTCSFQSIKTIWTVEPYVFCLLTFIYCFCCCLLALGTIFQGERVWWTQHQQEQSFILKEVICMHCLNSTENWVNCCLNIIVNNSPCIQDMYNLRIIQLKTGNLYTAAMQLNTEYSCSDLLYMHVCNVFSFKFNCHKKIISNSWITCIQNFFRFHLANISVFRHYTM